MPVTGFVGLPGSGKTLELVKRGIEARRSGRDVYANFRLGKRVDGWIVPTCPWGLHFGVFHGRSNPLACESTGYTVRVRSENPHLEVSAKSYGWRFGRVFVPDPKAVVLESWDDLINLRVFRDAFDIPHQLDCRVARCGGCSKGITVLLDELNLWAPSRLWQELGIGVLNRWAYVRKDGLEILWSAQHEARIDKVAREVTDFIYNCRSLGGKFTFMGHKIHLQVFHRTKWIPALMTEKNRTAAAEGANKAGMLGDFEMNWFHQSVADSYDTYEHVSDVGVGRGTVTPLRGRRPRASASAPRSAAGGDADLA